MITSNITKLKSPYRAVMLDYSLNKSGIKQIIIIIILSFMFAGGFQYLGVFTSSIFLYGIYAILFCNIFLIWMSYQITIEIFKPVVLYLIWLLFYFLWGSLFSLYQNIVLPEVARVLPRDILIIISTAIALKERKNLKLFAYFIQIAAITNCLICIQQSIDPVLLKSMVMTQNPDSTAFNVLRPGGLWLNPNEATFAFLFALLISYWLNGPVALLGRIAAIYGIYLTASRSGAYMLSILGAIYLLRKIKNRSFALSIFVTLILLFTAITILSISLRNNFISSLLNPGESYTLQRWTNPFDTTDVQIDRVDLTKEALEYALKAPWYGWGIFTFQLPGTGGFSNLFAGGAHNIYITVIGETGFIGLIGYLSVIGVGVYRAYCSITSPSDRLIVICIWGVYLIIGFVWHNQLTAISGAIYIGLLYQLPYTLQTFADFENR